MIATKESRTNNYKENILHEFDAVTHVLTLLFKTPYGSMPYCLGVGFELRDLLFKDTASSEYETSLNQLREQVRLITGNSDIDIAIDKQDKHTDIVLTVNVNGGKQGVNITVPIDGEIIKYKDITVV